MEKKKELKDHVSYKEVANVTKSHIKDSLLLFKEWITDYGKIILPMLLLILVCITVLISLNARERVELATKEALEVLEETKAEVKDVQETLFEEDAYPELNALMLTYYEALEMGDIDVLIDIQNSVSSTESIRLSKMSEYIDRYENIHVYTKPGPYVDTYIAYVYSDVFLKEREESTPGLQAFYVCTDDNGLLYINNSELTEEEALYIKNVSLQGDVVDLKNSVNVSYSDAMEENPELSEYWAGISVEIDLAVGEQLALDAKLVAQLEEETSKDSETDETESEEDVPSEPQVIKVKTTDQVNIRKSASASADRIGSAMPGETFVLIEKMTNGWSKVSYNGGEAFISSAYLVELEDITGVATANMATVNTSSLNVRTMPDQTSSKLGVLTQGQLVEVVENLDDWTKIKFDGQIGYVKSEFINQ